MTSTRDQRGFDIDEYPGSFRLAMVRAGVDDASQGLASLLGTERSVDIGQALADEGGISLYQFDGHAWTGLVPQTLPYDRVLSDETLARLSEQLGADVLCFEHEDTSGWSIFTLYRDGEAVDEYQWGVDYSEEYAEMDVDIEQLDDEWEVSVLGGDELAPDRFKFRSSIRSVDQEQVLDPSAFLDATYRDLDAWQPSLDALYAADNAQLVRADLVEAADG